MPLKHLFIALFFFITLDFGAEAYGSDNCLLKRPINSVSTEQFDRLKKCNLEQILQKNALAGEELRDLLTQAALVYPKSDFILSAARDFQDEGSPLILVSFTKPLKNRDLTSKLISVHFDRLMYSKQIKSSYDQIAEIIGKEEANKIFQNLLTSTNMTIVSNVADTITYAGTPQPVLFEQALSKLIYEAKRGRLEAFEILLWNKDYFSRLDPTNFYALASVYRPEAFDPSIASLVISRLIDVPYQLVDKRWFQKLFAHAASGDVPTNILARKMYEITGDRRFKINHKLLPEDSTSDFEKCSLDGNHSVFSCYEIVPISTDEIPKVTYHTYLFSLLIEQFEIEYEQNISERLIENFFARKIPYKLKSKFSKNMFIGVSLTNKHLSPDALNVFREIKAGINQYMWNHHAKDIIVDDDHNFPLFDEVVGNILETSILAFNSDHTFFEQNSYLSKVMPLLERVTSKDVLSDLSLAIYGLYGHWKSDDLEDLIDLAMNKTKTTSGVTSSLYFDFAYHKNLITKATGTIDRISFLIEQIDSMKKIGLDYRLFEDQLLEAYIKTEQLEKAREIIKQNSQRLDRMERLLDTVSDDQRAIQIFQIAVDRCSASYSIAQINKKTDGIANPSQIIRHCFNSFSYPSRVPTLLQTEIFAEFLGLSAEPHLELHSDIDKEKMLKYSMELLSDEGVTGWVKTPFAYAAIVLNSDKAVKENLWKRHFPDSLIHDTPLTMREKLVPAILWYKEAARASVFGKTTETSANLLEILYESSIPDLQSPIASLDAASRAAIFSTKYTEELFQYAVSDPVKLQTLYTTHQNYKFGPSEQLLLRGILIREGDMPSLQSKLTKRSLTVQKLLDEKISESEKANLQEILKKQNRELRSFAPPKFKAKEIYPNLILVAEKLLSTDVYLDFFHDKSSNSIGVLATRKSSVEYHTIPNADKIAAHSRSFRKKVIAGASDFGEEGIKIYEQIIKPFVKSDTKRILLAPHSFLFDIPYAALVINQTERSSAIAANNSVTRGINLNTQSSKVVNTNDYLGENFELAIVSTIVKSAKHEKKGGYSFVGVGNPIFDNQEEPVSLAFTDFTNLPNRSGVKISSLPQLPGTQQELETMASLPIFSKSNLFTGKDANKKVLFNSKELQNASVISFATHGLAAGQISDYSEPGLALTPSETVQIEKDGFLSLTDILQLRLQSEIVILSACNTGSSMSLHSPPFSGLATAFLAAGSDSVLASLWPVDDRATTLLMEMIGLEKAKNSNWTGAQKTAISKFIKMHPEYEHPRFWASFLLFRPLED